MSATAATIARLIPHADRMCLLARIRDYDDACIVCEADSHRDADNPLRHNGRLSVQAGIEYAAQAVAVHGGLREGRDGNARAGYIVILSKVDWQHDRLDDVAGPLIVSAERHVALSDGFSYRFSVSGDERLLIQGEMIVSLLPEGLAP